jgi:NAD(P)-dependent dehydrogenase (short-subunit alcohol dehydrogenase family)
VTDQWQAREVVEHTIGELDRLDALVNNAGIMLLGLALDAPAEEWSLTFSVTTALLSARPAGAT